MARKSEAISEELVLRCKEELKQQGIRGENGRRLQAIISAKVYGIQKVAQVYQISRSTLMRWIAKFENGGSAGFAVGAGRGRRSRLSDEQKQEVRAWVLQEGARLTAKHAQQYIGEHFAIEISTTVVTQSFSPAIALVLLCDSIEHRLGGLFANRRGRGRQWCWGDVVCLAYARRSALFPGQRF